MKKTDKFARKALAGMVALGMVVAAARAGADDKTVANSSATR